MRYLMVTGLLQDGVDDVDDHILSNNIRLDDPGLVVLGGDHVDVILEDLGLQLVLRLCLQRRPTFWTTVTGPIKSSLPGFP